MRRKRKVGQRRGPIGLISFARVSTYLCFALLLLPYRVLQAAPPRISEPEEIKYSGDLGHIARLPDGRLISIYTLGRPREEASLPGPEQPAYVRYSDDHGRTWSESRALFSYPAGRGIMPLMDQSQGPYILIDRDGSLHLFALRSYQTLVSDDPSSFSYSELLYTSTSDGGQSWSPLKRIDYGFRWTGEIMSVLELGTGRILIPVGYFTDNFISERGEYERRITTVFSDDGGKSWQRGQDDIKVPIGSFIGHTGAMEPVMVELRDGRVWMLIRTQTPRLYETFSTDGGETWSVPAPSAFRAPNAPAAVLRMTDGRLVLSWNDVSMYPGDEVIRAGRQYLHIAISEDDGKTWQPSRLIAQPRPGDPENVHVRYPFLCETADGKLLVRYHRVWGGRRLGGITRARELLSVDPGWIQSRGLETSARKRTESEE